MATRILIVTQWFDPEPTLKGLAFARELQHQGFDVDVVTGFPNYPGGKVYPGYSIKLFQKEEVDGLRIARVPLYPSHGRSGVKRALNYLTFAFSAAVYALFFVRRPSLIYVYHPPLTAAAAANLVGLLRRTPVVCDIQDLWPDTLQATGMLRSERLLAVVSRVCDWVYRRSERLVVLSPGFGKVLVSRGVPPEKISVIMNWCDEASLASRRTAPPAAFPVGKFTVLFAGNMGPAQGLVSVLDAAAIVGTEQPAVQFVFLGSGLELSALKATAAKRRLSNVSFLPAVPMAEVASYLQAADVLLVHLRRDPLFEITIPSKTQAYMCAGRPILMAVSGDAAALVKESGCGVTATWDDAKSIACAVLRFWQMPAAEREQIGAAGAAFYRERLSQAAGSARFAALFAEVSAQCDRGAA